MTLLVVVLAVCLAVSLSSLLAICLVLVREQERARVAAAVERNALLERIQRPDVPLEVVVPGELSTTGPAKLWRSEEDEIRAAQEAALDRIEQLEAEL